MSASIVHWSVGLTVDVHEQKAPSSSANGGKNQERDSCSLMDCPFDIRRSVFSIVSSEGFVEHHLTFQVRPVLDQESQGNQEDSDHLPEIAHKSESRGPKY